MVSEHLEIPLSLSNMLKSVILYDNHINVLLPLPWPGRCVIKCLIRETATTKTALGTFLSTPKYFRNRVRKETINGVK